MTDVAADHGIAAVVVALLSGGMGKYGYDLIKDMLERRANRPNPELQRHTVVDASLLTVAKARDELAEDLAQERRAHALDVAAERAENTRLRTAMADAEARAAQREATLRGEIEHLEERLRAILDELTSVKTRYGLSTRSSDPA